MIVDVDTAHKISMINVPVLPNNGNNMSMINDPGLPNNGHIIQMINVPGLPNICRQSIKESDIIFHSKFNQYHLKCKKKIRRYFAQTRKTFDWIRTCGLYISNSYHWPENTQRRGKYHSAGCLQFIWIRFDLTRDMLLFV